jgi:hypothetical protein
LLIRDKTSPREFDDNGISLTIKNSGEIEYALIILCSIYSQTIISTKTHNSMRSILDREVIKRRTAIAAPILLYTNGKEVYHSIICTSQYSSKALYTSGRKGSLLLFSFFRQISEKDHRIQYENTVVASSQPKSIGANAEDIVSLVMYGVQNK